MTPHTERVELRLTPLCPIHVGAGEEFDPTGYVIDEGVLFHFDPAAVPLDSADRKALLAAVNQQGDAAILAVQRFFSDRAGLCKGAARQAVPVAAGVAAQYRKRVGQVAQREQSGGRVANLLEIERTVHHPHSGIAYLPGTSLKGAMRTAWLDRINGGRARPHDERAQAMEKRLLDGGAFHTDPFRLLALGDATGPQVASQVYFSTNHKKQLVQRDGQEMAGRGPSARRECVAAGQYGALACSLAVDSLDGQHDTGRTPAPSGRIRNWRDLAAACNRYYLPRIDRELQLLDERRFVSPGWSLALRGLLTALEPAFQAGDALLLRVGRHSGADNVTLDGVRQIRIMKGPGQPAELSDVGATTVWLAAEHDNDRTAMQPFGWLVLHRADQPLPALRAWCDAQPKPDMAAIANTLTAARQAQQEARRKQQEALAEQARAAAAEQQAAAEQAQRLQALSDQGRAVETLRTQLLQHTAARKQPVGGQLYQNLRQLLQQAEQGSWPQADRQALADLLRTVVPEKIDLGGKAKDIKQAAARLSAPG
jgi:CRISPR-associated protein Csm5